MTNFLSIWNFIFDFIILFHHHFVHLFTMKLINNLPCLHMFDDNNNVYESFPHLICVRVSCLLCLCVYVFMSTFISTCTKTNKNEMQWKKFLTHTDKHLECFLPEKTLLSIVFFVVVAQLLTNDYFHPFFVLIHSFVHSVFYFTVYNVLNSNALRYR